MKRLCSILVLSVAAAGLVSPAIAGEKGKFRGLAVLVSTQFQQIKALEGHPGGPQMQGQLDGLIFNDSRQPFLDKALYQVIWKADMAGGNCFKTFATSEGKVFARCEGRNTATGSEGTVTLLGGTGRYTGIKGKGTFLLTSVSDTVMWDILEWDYEVP